MSTPPEDSIRNQLSEDRLDFAVARWLTAILVFFYLSTTAGHRPYGDEAIYLDVADNMIVQGAPVLTHFAPPGVIETALREYSKFPLGQSLLELPEVFLVRVIAPISLLQPLFHNILPALECAIIAALLYLLVRLPEGGGVGTLLSRRVSAVLALATGVATQLWPSASTHFADTSATFLTFVAIYMVVRFRRVEAGPWYVVVAACAIALAFLCKNIYILVLPALAAYTLWAVWLRRPVTGFQISPRNVSLAVFTVLPLIIAIVIQLWFNYLRYDSFWSSGYQQGRDGDFGFNTPLLVGLYGIFFSSGRSLFLYSPLCLMAFFGWRRFGQRWSAESWLLAGITVPLTFTFARWWSWHGGWEWGCRFYLLLVPALIWCSAPAWSWLDDLQLPRFAYRVRVALLTLLIGVSLFIQILGVLVSPITPWVIMVEEIKVLESPIYQKGAWDIRDDMPLNHFVPEFSPVAMNAWLVWATWNRAVLSETELAHRIPMHQLNPKWEPNHVFPYLGYDLWFWGDLTRPDGLKSFVASVLLILYVLAGISLSRIIALTRPAKKPGNNGELYFNGA